MAIVSAIDKAINREDHQSHEKDMKAMQMEETRMFMEQMERQNAAAQESNQAMFDMLGSKTEENDDLFATMMGDKPAGEACGAHGGPAAGGPATGGPAAGGPAGGGEADIADLIAALVEAIKGKEEAQSSGDPDKIKGADELEAQILEKLSVGGQAAGGQPAGGEEKGGLAGLLGNVGELAGGVMSMSPAGGLLDKVLGGGDDKGKDPGLGGLLGGLGELVGGVAEKAPLGVGVGLAAGGDDIAKMINPNGLSPFNGGAEGLASDFKSQLEKSVGIESEEPARSAPAQGGAGEAGGTEGTPKEGLAKVLEGLIQLAGEGKAENGGGEAPKEAAPKEGLEGKVDELIGLLEELMGKDEGSNAGGGEAAGGPKKPGGPEGREAASGPPDNSGPERKIDTDKALDQYSSKVDRAVDNGLLTEAEGARLVGQMEGKVSQEGPVAKDFKAANDNLDALVSIDSKAAEVHDEIGSRVEDGEISGKAGEKATALVNDGVAEAKAAVLDGADTDAETGKTDADVLSNLDKNLDKLDGDLNTLAASKAEGEAVAADEQKGKEAVLLNWG